MNLFLKFQATQSISLLEIGKSKPEAWGHCLALMVTVREVPLEISKLCHYFICRSGEISGAMKDNRHRRSPIASGGIKIKMRLTLKGAGEIICKMKQLIREGEPSTLC